MQRSINSGIMPPSIYRNHPLVPIPNETQITIQRLQDVIMDLQREIDHYRIMLGEIEGTGGKS